MRWRQATADLLPSRRDLRAVPPPARVKRVASPAIDNSHQRVNLPSITTTTSPSGLTTTRLQSTSSISPQPLHATVAVPTRMLPHPQISRTKDSKWRHERVLSWAYASQAMKGDYYDPRSLSHGYEGSATTHANQWLVTTRHLDLPLWADTPVVCIGRQWDRTHRRWTPDLLQTTTPIRHCLRTEATTHTQHATTTRHVIGSNTHQRSRIGG